MWGEIEPELRRVLGRLVQPADVDDIVQEVFIRLAARCERKPLPVEAVVDLAKLAGWNLGLNAVRDAAARAMPADTVPDIPGANDVEEQAVWHLSLDRVLAAVAEMSEADRRVIAEALSPPADRGATKREQDRISLRLFRARNRLRARTAGVLSAFPLLRWRLRARPEWAQAFGPLGATMMVATVVGVLGTPTSAPPVSVDVVTTAATPGPTTAPAAPVPAPVEHRAALAAVTPEQPAPAPLAAPAPEAAVPAPPAPIVSVAHPAGGATVGGRDGREGDPLACFGGGPLTEVQETICVPHPLR